MNAASFTVSLWFSAASHPADLPALATDKDWESGDLVDVTSNHDLGWTRTSGSDPGWALVLGREGAWQWNAGDGEHRLDYRPPAPAQFVADGNWHLLAFTVDGPAAEARLYRDGASVALFSTAGLGALRSGAPARAVEATDRRVVDLRVDDGAATPEEIARRWLAGPPGGAAPPQELLSSLTSRGLSQERVESLRVMAWNIWHGGRRDGNEEGLQATIEAIRAAGADVIAMQETYGSGAHIAEGLGFHWYLRSSNLSVMSRYPIRQTHDLPFDPFRLGGVTLELSAGQQVNLFSLWIHYLPDYGGRLKDLDTPLTADELIAGERETRGAEIAEILRLLQPLRDRSDGVPLIVAGDFNSPSHLDWAANTADGHRGLVVDWPVSRAMAEAGFVDAFRTVHPDPVAEPGRTWSPRFTDAWQDRIDRVYLHGPRLVPTAARMHDQVAPRWPSDHAAVVVDLSLR
jgi:endonuclease/exonuclease/phosphatase family metal-dependent hydrolase